MDRQICLSNKKSCVGYKDGECISISIENCMNKADTYKYYELNLDRINSVDDCKKILKFLCELTIKPLPSDIEYGGFSEVSKYFNR